jgi:hypothetical protein
MDAYSDLTMAQDANVSRGFPKMIPLPQNVNYCAANGMTRPMTLARAMAAKKRGGVAEICRGEMVSIVGNTPPPC